MFLKKPLAFAFRSVPLAALLAASSLFVTAQDDDEVIEEVIVTGSRLQANPNLAGAVPVLSVMGEEASQRGNVRIEDFVNVLPQVFAGQASEVSNGASGTATLNLRGVGSTRTLVLIDGRRLPYGSSSVSSANLDIIPSQMIERIDILTGGASAVYGSDAVGGVANFILKRDFEGVEVGGQFLSNYAENDHGPWAQVLEAAEQPVPGSTNDGEEYMWYGMMGTNLDDGKGNVTFFASYEDRNEILQSNRISSGCALGQNDGAQSFAGFGCIGSANYRLFGGAGGYRFQQADGTIVPYAGGPAMTFNFGPFNFFQRPSERYQFFTKGHYQVTDTLEAYADFGYTTNVSDAQIAPTASFGIGAYQINCGNPFLAEDGMQADGYGHYQTFGCSDEDIANDVIKSRITASHRNVEGGPRNSRLENSAMRFVGGFRGTLADTWDWSVFGSIAETQDESNSTNDFVVANLQQALFATTDANGNVVCTDPSGGCVPYNIFQRSSSGGTMVTQEMIDFIHGLGIVTGSTSQLAFGGDIQANLGEYGIKMPTTDAGVGLLVGVEYRKDTLDARPDEISQVPGGGFTGVGGADLPVKGRVDVMEFFAELEIPILVDADFAKELALRGQFRTSSYDAKGNNTSNSFDADAYGVSLTWAPTEDFRFRAQYQRAVRAPNVIALYTGINTGLPNLSPAGTNANGVQLFDPCASDSPIASLSACENTGVTAAQYGTILDVISGQTQSLTGGNPFLDPEEADTYTYGVVWQPSAIEDLTVSLDFFDITIEEAISAGISAQVALDNCLSSGQDAFCSLITRSIEGSLAAGTSGVGFSQQNINIAAIETTGVDLQIAYSFDVADGHMLRFDYAGTLLDALDQIPYPGATAVECSGFFGNNCPLGAGANPEYRHRLNATWVNPMAIDVVATWRHFGGTDNDNPNDDLESSLKSVNYLDVVATYEVTDNLTVRAGALNLFGETAPVFSGAGPALGNGNTYPTTFDVSTTMYASLKYAF